MKYIESRYKQRIFSIIIAILPILSPYAIKFGNMNLSITYILSTSILLYFIFIKKILFIDKRLSLFLIIMFISTIISYIFTANKNLSISLAMKVLVIFVIYLITYSNIWQELNISSFYEIIEAIGLICAILAIIQFLFLSIGKTNIYNGRLPFSLESYSSFGSLIDPYTGVIRVHSFFEEPSYLAMYLLPIAAYCLQKEKYLKGIIIAISCIISGTALGLIGIVIIIFVAFLNSINNIKKQIQFSVIAIIASIILLFILSKSNLFNNLINYYIFRYLNIGRDFSRTGSSISQRIIGNIGLFKEYSVLNKIIGTGINQYKLFFNLNVDYSNDFVSIILNYGIIGLITLVAWLGFLYNNIKREGIIYFLFLFMVLAIDHSWFSDNYFYLMTWVIINSKYKNYIKLKI